MEVPTGMTSLFGCATYLFGCATYLFGRATYLFGCAEERDLAPIGGAEECNLAGALMASLAEHKVTAEAKMSYSKNTLDEALYLDNNWIQTFVKCKLLRPFIQSHADGALHCGQQATQQARLIED